jgi:hypothetical protein
MLHLPGRSCLLGLWLERGGAALVRARGAAVGGRRRRAMMRTSAGLRLAGAASARRAACAVVDGRAGAALVVQQRSRPERCSKVFDMPVCNSSKLNHRTGAPIGATVASRFSPSHPIYIRRRAERRREAPSALDFSTSMSLSLVVALGAGAPLGVWPASPLDAERGPMGVNLIVNPKAASGSAQWDVSENCMHSGLYGYRVVIVSPFPNAAVRQPGSELGTFTFLGLLLTSRARSLVRAGRDARFTRLPCELVRCCASLAVGAGAAAARQREGGRAATTEAGLLRRRAADSGRARACRARIAPPTERLQGGRAAPRCEPIAR